MASVAARLYDLIDQRRAIDGLSWTDLHRKSGVARSTMLRWRTGTGTPQAPTVIAVADALGVNRELALHLGGVIASPAAERASRKERLESELDAMARRMDQIRAELAEVNADREGAADDRRPEVASEPRPANGSGVSKGTGGTGGGAG